MSDTGTLLSHKHGKRRWKEGPDMSMRRKGEKRREEKLYLQLFGVQSVTR